MRSTALFGLLIVVCCCSTGAARAADNSPRPADQYGSALKLEMVKGVGPCHAVEVVGDRLYAIGRGSLYVLDITRPAAPKLLGELSGLGNTRQLVVRDGCAFVTARQDGLWLIDVSRDDAPRLISHYDTVEMATGIWVSGPVAFVATRCYGVELVDVSDLEHPRHLSVLKTGEAQSCWARDGLLYIGDWAPKKLLIADVHNPLQPQMIGEAELDGYGDGGCLRGKYCYAATGHHSRALRIEDRDGTGHGLEIVDVSNPLQPRRVAGVKFPPSYVIYNDMWASRVAGDFCVAADTWNGVFVVNVADVEHPRIVAHAVLPTSDYYDKPDPVGGIALADGVIYAAGISTGLYVVSAPGMAQPVVLEHDTPPSLTTKAAADATDADFYAYQPDGQVRSVTVQEDVAWAACGIAGIQAVQITADSLEPISVTPTADVAFHVHVEGNRLYSAESAAGLGIYDIQPDKTLKEIGRLHLNGQNVKQVVCPPPGQYALFHCGGSQAYIADLSDPTQPRVVLKDPQVGLFYGDQLVPEMLGGRYLVAYWQRSGPAWYDVGTKQPKLLGNSPDDRLYSWTDGACALGDQLLIVKRGKLQVLEVAEMRDVDSLPKYAPKGPYLRGRPTTDGKRAALARRHERHIQLLDISDISKPKLIREYDTVGHPGACGFWHGRLVVPASYQGLLLEKKVD